MYERIKSQLRGCSIALMLSFSLFVCSVGESAEQNLISYEQLIELLPPDQQEAIRNPSVPDLIRRKLLGNCYEQAINNAAGFPKNTNLGLSTGLGAVDTTMVQNQRAQNVLTALGIKQTELSAISNQALTYSEYKSILRQLPPGTSGSVSGYPPLFNKTYQILTGDTLGHRWMWRIDENGALIQRNTQGMTPWFGKLRMGRAFAYENTAAIVVTAPAPSIPQHAFARRIGQYGRIDSMTGGGLTIVASMVGEATFGEFDMWLGRMLGGYSPTNGPINSFMNGLDMEIQDAQRRFTRSWFPEGHRYPTAAEMEAYREYQRRRLDPKQPAVRYFE